MKKGLLSILALAVTIVGCQNYDDQFDALNTQITALKSQVDGLAAVQSAVTALQGQLSALSSAALTNADLDAALSAGLADIIADVEDLQSSLTDVATSEDLDAIETDLDTVDESLQDLLQSSNVYGEDLIIKNSGTLDFAVSLGEKLTIVNGSVVFDVTSSMDINKVQEVINNIGVVVEDFTYISASTVSPVTFNEITGVNDLELDMAGDYHFASLESANDIHFEMGTKVTAINLDALTSVNSFNVSTIVDNGGSAAAAYATTASSTSHAINGSKLADLQLGSLVNYPNASLSITLTNDEAVLDIASLASVDADGDEATLNLTVDGALAFNFSAITRGNIVAKNVTTLTGGSDHDGNVTLENVVNVVLPNLTGDLTFGSGDDGSSLTTFHAIGALASREATQTADNTHSDLVLSSQSNLASAIIEGDLKTVTVSGNGDLTSLTYSANAGDLTISNNSDIVSIDLGGTAQSITVTGNSDLESMDIDTELNTEVVKDGTTAGSTATTGSLTITNNDNLLDFDSAFDPVSSITVTGNQDLTNVDFDGTATVGGTATTVASVNISGNDLTAESVEDAYEASATATDGGTISDEAGLSSLNTYVTAAAAKLGTSGSIVIKLDKIETLTIKGESVSDDTEDSDVIATSTANTAYLTVVELSPNTAGNTVEAVTAEKGKYAYQITPASGGDLSLTHSFAGITTNMLSTVDVGSQNPVLAIDNILTDALETAGDAVEVTVNAIRGGEADIDIVFQTTVNSTTSEIVPTAATDSTTAIATTDVITITVNGKTATGTPAAAVSTDAAAAHEVAAVWNAAIAVAGNTISDTMFDVDGDTVSGTLTISGKQKFGSLTNGKGFAISVASGTDTTTNPIIGYKAGNFLSSTGGDNLTISDNVIITIESDDTGVDADTAQASAVTVAYTGTGPTALTASATADYNAPVTGVTAVAAPSNATTTNRMAWIG